MGFRDDDEAVRARADALERENLELRQRLAAQEQAGQSSGAAPPKRTAVSGRSVVLVAFGLGVIVMGVVLVVGVDANPLWLLACFAMGSTLATAGVVANLLVIAQPNELVIISGRPRRAPDGRVLGYRVIRGRAIRLPILERADCLDLTNLALEIALQRVHARDGTAALGVKANVKLAGTEPDLHRAVERFLGRSRSEIATVAREIIEGAIGSVVALLAVEQLQADRLYAGQKIAEEAGEELRKLGIELTTLQIERVELS
jgi:uncharacterized membrane protein YqiK